MGILVFSQDLRFKAQAQSLGDVSLIMEVDTGISVIQGAPRG